MELREQAFEMFNEGKKINQVAKVLFKNNWAKTKQLHIEWQGANGIATTALERAKPTAAGDEPEKWDLTIAVSTNRLDAILASFNPNEKATAIQEVLQIRMDAPLGA